MPQMIFIERDGTRFDMKIHPPVPAARGAMYHFVESILTGKPHTATGEEGLTVMKLLDAIYKSARKGRPGSHSFTYSRKRSWLYTPRFWSLRRRW